MWSWSNHTSIIPEDVKSLLFRQELFRSRFDDGQVSEIHVLKEDLSRRCWIRSLNLVNSRIGSALVSGCHVNDPVFLIQELNKLETDSRRTSSHDEDLHMVSKIDC
jgi:hypothetical protein